MLTTFEQVKEWITENGFKRWVLYRDRSRQEKIIDSNAFSVSDQADKLAMTEKYLRQAGGYAFAAGSTTGAQADLNVTMEIRLEAAQPTAGVGSQDTEALKAAIRAEMKAEYDRLEYERKKKELDEERAEFDKMQAGVWGVLVNKVGPVIMNALQGNRLVAGLDADEPVHADPVKPIVPAEKEPEQEQEKVNEEEENPFTDEENEELFVLLSEFKKLEPDYLKLIRGVVEMKKSGNPMYETAKSWLVKLVE